MKLGEIARILQGSIEGKEDIDITGLASLEDAKPSDITFLESRSLLSKAKKSSAGAIIVGNDIQFWGKTLLRVSYNPKLAFVRLLEIFAPTVTLPSEGIHPSAVVSGSAVLEEGVRIGPFVYIGEDVRIGRDVVIHPNCYIGDRVHIEDNTVIYPGVVVREDVRIGRNVIIHSGAVIGSDGFGYMPDGDGNVVKIPQIGGVIIGNNVEIGANSTIDRSTTGFTIIGDNTKIDNLVHVAHNVTIGKNCFLTAQVGIAGSVHIGDNVSMGGKSGVKDHVNVGSNVMVAARSGVTRDVPDGMFVSGFPAREHGKELKIQALMWKLPDIYRRLLEIENELKEMKKGAL